LKEEIKKRKEALFKIKEMKDNFRKININLDKFSIKPMGTFEIIDEFKDYSLEDPREVFAMNIESKKRRGIEKKALNLGELVKEITFDDKKILSERHLIIKKIIKKEKNINKNILEYNKCAFTIVKVKAIDNLEEGEVEMNKQYANCMKNIEALGEKHIGRAFLKMSLSAYENDKAMMYLEIYVPLK
ncbi:MAG: hypothetical protein ACRDCW_08570, partial [Sarcina sp.]